MERESEKVWYLSPVELYTSVAVTVMGNWEGDGDFQTVTNKIAVTNGLQFIQLNIE